MGGGGPNSSDISCCVERRLTQPKPPLQYWLYPPTPKKLKGKDTHAATWTSISYTHTYCVDQMIYYTRAGRSICNIASVCITGNLIHIYKRKPPLLWKALFLCFLIWEHRHLHGFSCNRFLFVWEEKSVVNFQWRNICLCFFGGYPIWTSIDTQ